MSGISVQYRGSPETHFSYEPSQGPSAHILPVIHGPLSGPTVLLVHIKTVIPIITFLGLWAAAELDIYVKLQSGWWFGRPFRTPGKGVQIFLFNLCTLTAASCPTSVG